MTRPRFHRPVSPENQAKGADAEAAFQVWLNDSRLPFIYATQDRQSVPLHFKGQLKRPDYLVALPFVGTIAVDVKAKTIYEGCLIFDVEEIERLTKFDEIFRITTFLVCMDPFKPSRSWWFRLAPLSRLTSERRMGVMTVQVALCNGLEADMTQPFQEALRDVLLL